MRQLLPSFGAFVGDRHGAGGDLPPVGSDRETVTIRGVRMTIYTYRPTGCVEPALLFVFHGNSRTASNYLEYARPLADRACFLVFAPLFDEERFPNWSYHRGGIVNEDGRGSPG